MLRKLNNSDYVGASLEFPRWNKDNGKEILGLTKRRILEQANFA
jgi:lysozyme